jgi:excisionase family DNA binding protein
MGQRPMAMRPTTAHLTAVRPMIEQPAPRAPLTFLTVAEVAAIMRLSKMTVYRLVHSGELAAVRVGRSFRVRSLRCATTWPKPAPTSRDNWANSRTKLPALRGR